MGHFRFPLVLEEVQARVPAIVEELNELHQRKSADYGSDRDPLGNIRDVESMGVPALVGVTVRMTDKFARIKSFHEKGHLLNESLRDSYVDNAVYSILACIVMDDDAEEED